MTSLLEILGGSPGGALWGGIKMLLLVLGSFYLARHFDFPSLRWFWSVLVLNSVLFVVVQANKEKMLQGLFLFLQGSFAAVASMIVLALVAIDSLRMLARARPAMRSAVFDWAHRQAVYTRNRGLTAVGLSVLGLASALLSLLFR